MGWAVGYDPNWERWVGYGVPAYCDEPGCLAEIDRGLAYICCKQQMFGGDDGCGLFFCGKHKKPSGKCARCRAGAAPAEPTPDHPAWIAHMATDPSWEKWRVEHGINN